MGIKNIILISSLFLFGCAQGHCRKVNDVKSAQATAEATSGESSVKKIFVYKPDGSKQCEKGPAISVADMGKELNDIKIFSSKKQNDGMMHMAVCGGQTGMINIYEIEADHLELALSRGFREWRN